MLDNRSTMATELQHDGSGTGPIVTGWERKRVQQLLVNLGGPDR